MGIPAQAVPAQPGDVDSNIPVLLAKAFTLAELRAAVHLKELMIVSQSLSNRAPEPVNPSLEGDSYYFWYEQTEEDRNMGELTEDSDVRFYIVHRRYWHHHHALADHSPDVRLPADFYEVGESTYEYDGSWTGGKRRLIERGFHYLDTEWRRHDALVTHVIRVGSAPSCRFDWQCDNPEIQDSILVLHRELENDPGRTPDIVEARLMLHCHSMGWIYIRERATSDYHSGCIMPIPVFDGLPG